MCCDGTSLTVGLMLDQRLRRWPNIKPTVSQCLLGCAIPEFTSPADTSLYTLAKRPSVNFLCYFPENLVTVASSANVTLIDQVLHDRYSHQKSFFCGIV